MGILSQLEPGKVFYYFEEICKIPHGSGNVSQISNYLADFARERNLFYIQDKWFNVIIIKEATPGYEAEPPVILQGHMDMVAVKKPELIMDMQKSGLNLAVKGDLIYAEGTSLGGDDGIAVAYALALLDSDGLKHPRLEVVLTVDEEVGMDGARKIDLSMLKGSRMLNLDSEEEGIFLSSCAGGGRVDLQLPLLTSLREGVEYEIKVDGLQGGHSGVEIHKERGNANSLLGRLLFCLAGSLDMGIKECSGGLADNAIPRESRAVIVIGAQEENLFQEIVKKQEAGFREEFSTKDPGLCIRVKKKEKEKEASAATEANAAAEKGYCVAGKEAGKLAAFLWGLPNGVVSMSADISGLVETSLNMGMLKLSVTSEEAVLGIGYSVRSSVESAKWALIDKLASITWLAGGDVKVSGDYPGWKYRVNSPLRDKMICLYEEMYGQPPKVEAIHAGLECGLLGSKLKDLDCVSLGPDMKDIHTTEETLSIASTKRVWDFLVRLLEKKDV